MDDWEKDLNDLVRQEERRQEKQVDRQQGEIDQKERNRRKAVQFIESVVAPAFNTLKDRFNRQWPMAQVKRDVKPSPSLTLEVERADSLSFQQTIWVQYDSTPAIPQVHGMSESYGVKGVDEVTKEDICKDTVNLCRKQFEGPEL